MLDKACIIVNPAARGHRARGLLRKLLAGAPEPKIYETAAGRHAAELARRAVDDGHSIVIAAGGDGTIHEVVNGLAGTQAVLGVLPLGTVNLLARELGISLDPAIAWRQLARAEPKMIDLGKIECRDREGSPRSVHFAQLGAAGWDAGVIEEVQPAFKKRWGRWSYVWVGLKMLCQSHQRFTAEMPGGTTLCGSLALVGNGRLYGGPFPIWPEAKLDDGLLDLCMLDSDRVVDVLGFFHRSFMGQAGDPPFVKRAQAARIFVEGPGRIPLQADGEAVGRGPAEIRVVPGALRVLAPTARPAA